MEATPAQSIPFVESRKVGDATIASINEAMGDSTFITKMGVPEEVWRKEMTAGPKGQVPLSYRVAHVRIGAASILIDLGFDDPTPESEWSTPRYTHTAGAPAGLLSIGVRPEDVTHVLITHAHSDHVAGGSVVKEGGRVPRYPNGRHYIHRLEWEGNPEREQPSSALAIHLGTVAKAGLFELIDEERDIVDGVTMIHAPGETAGHSIVRVQSGGETFLYLGDLFHHPIEVAHVDWIKLDRDATQMIATRRRVIDEAVSSNALILSSHVPWFGRIIRADRGYNLVAAP